MLLKSIHKIEMKAEFFEYINILTKHKAKLISVFQNKAVQDDIIFQEFKDLQLLNEIDRLIRFLILSDENKVSNVGKFIEILNKNMPHLYNDNYTTKNLSDILSGLIDVCKDIRLSDNEDELFARYIKSILEIKEDLFNQQEENPRSYKNAIINISDIMCVMMKDMSKYVIQNKQKITELEKNTKEMFDLCHKMQAQNTAMAKHFVNGAGFKNSDNKFQNFMLKTLKIGAALYLVYVIKRLIYEGAIAVTKGINIKSFLFDFFKSLL